MKISIKVVELIDINTDKIMLSGAYRKNNEKFSDFIKRTVAEYKKIFDIDVKFNKVLYSTTLDTYDMIDFENKSSYSNITATAFGLYISYLQEKIFGTISWDYSYLRFNLNGRTSLLHASFWGLMGVLFYEFLLPRIISFKKYLNYNWTKVLTIVFSFIFLFDATISCVACHRQAERREGVLPTNSVERFLDHHYPDEYLNKIYNNAKVLPK